MEFMVFISCRSCCIMLYLSWHGWVCAALVVGDVAVEQC